MSGDNSTPKQPTGSLLPLLLQAIHDRQSSMDRRLQTIETIHMQGWSRQGPTGAPTDTTPSIWSRLREAVTLANLAVKAWQMFKLVPWVGMLLEGLRMLFRFLGLR